MKPAGVVALDPGVDGRLRLGAGGEAVAVDELALQARPKCLGHAVVEARGHATCGLGDAVGDTGVSVVLAEILTASVVINPNSG